MQFQPITLTVGASTLLYSPRNIDRNRVATFMLDDETGKPLFGRPQLTYHAKQTVSANGSSNVRVRLSEPVLQVTTGDQGSESFNVLRTGRADVSFNIPTKATPAERDALFDKTIAALFAMRDSIVDASPVWA